MNRIRSGKLIIHQSLFAILFLFLNYFVFSIFRNSVSMVFPELGNEFRIGDVQLGFLISFQLITSVVTSLASGPIEARIGRRTTIGIGFLLCFVGTIAFGLSMNYLSALIFIALFGLGQGLFVPPMYSAMGVFFPNLRGFIAGITHSAFNLGGFIGPWFVGNLVSYGWRFPFLLVGGVGLVTLFFERLLVKYPENVVGRGPSFSASAVDLLELRNMRILLLTMFFSFFSMSAFLTWTPTFLREVRGLDPAAAGLIFGLSSAAAILGNVSFGWLSDRFGRIRVAALTAFASSFLVFLFYTQFPGILLLACISAMFGALAHPHWILQVAIVQDLIRPDMATAAIALIRVASMIGGIISPIVIGLLIPIVSLSQALIYTVPVFFLLYGILVLTLQSKKTFD
jgi:MFS family permease